LFCYNTTCLSISKFWLSFQSKTKTPFSSTDELPPPPYKKKEDNDPWAITDDYAGERESCLAMIANLKRQADLS